MRLSFTLPTTLATYISQSGSSGSLIQLLGQNPHRIARDSHFPQVLLARQSVHSNQIYVKLNQIGATRALPIQCFDQIETRKSQQVIYCHCHHIISIVMGAHFGPLRVLVAFSNARRVTNIDFLFAETPLAGVL